MGRRATDAARVRAFDSSFGGFAPGALALGGFTRGVLGTSGSLFGTSRGLLGILRG